MLREVPAFAPPSHDQDMAEDFSPTTDALDDIFGSGPNSPNGESNHNLETLASVQSNSVNTERSDIPRLRSTHVTTGYRDGIAESKASFVQTGFDEGFSLGAVLGTKSGYLLGVLEGIVRATTTASPLSEMAELFLAAREELSLRSLFGRNYFGEDGIWKYDVHGKEDEVTFREVADAHPLIAKWEGKVQELESKFGLDLTPKSRPRAVDEDEVVQS